MVSAGYAQVVSAVSKALGEEFVSVIANGPLMGKEYYTINVKRWSENGEAYDRRRVSQAVQYMNIVFNLKRI